MYLVAHQDDCQMVVRATWLKVRIASCHRRLPMIRYLEQTEPCRSTTIRRVAA